MLGFVHISVLVWGLFNVASLFGKFLACRWGLIKHKSIILFPSHHLKLLGQVVSSPKVLINVCLYFLRGFFRSSFRNHQQFKSSDVRILKNSGHGILQVA